MKIKMSKTTDGSVDGIQVSAYEKGVTYDLTATEGERELATAFVDAELATEVGAKTGAKPADTDPK